jgi:steroid delta-isomerase-like uncharacterized protein
MAAGSPRAGVVRRYVESWNEHDPAKVAATLGPGGTYSDPTATNSPLEGPALEEHLRKLFDAFPDLSLEVAVDLPASDAAVSWLMRGTHTGRWNEMPPLGGVLDLRGVDLLKIENGEIRAVERHFDRQTMAQQLGFEVVVQPAPDGVWQLGYSWRATSGSTAAPGAISITWTEARSREEAEELEAVGGLFGAELTEAPGFISVITGGIGTRLFTVAAWESAEAIPPAMRNKLHTGGVKRFHTEDFLGSFGFGVFTTHRAGPVLVRCTSCAALTGRYGLAGSRDGLDGNCSCGQPLPKTPQSW